MATQIRYITGDATRPINDADFRVIVHCCNDEGKWGAGFVLALSKRDNGPEMVYRRGPFELGTVKIVPFAEDNLFVANIIGQHLTGVDELGNSPVRYDAIRQFG